MRILLDECVHRKTARALPLHDIVSVPQHGWAGVKNGELLKRAAIEFEAFIPSDKNLEYQQHEGSLPIPVIILKSIGNTWSAIEPLIPKLLLLLNTPLDNKFYFVE